MTEKVQIPLLSDLIGHRFTQHAESECRKNDCLRYLAYLVPENYEQQDAVAFASENSIPARSRTNVLSVNRLSGSEEAGVDVEHSESES